MAFGNSGRPVHVEVHGVPLRMKRWSGRNSDFHLTVRVYDGDEFHDISRTFNLHSGKFSDDDRFNPTTRGDWKKEDIQRAISEVIESSSRVSSEDVEAITDVEMEERRAFITQPWKDSEVQLYEQGVIPEDDYSGPDPEEYRDGER